jgi:hypothetical protein
VIEKYKDDEGDIAIITASCNEGWFTDATYRAAYGEKILFDVTLVKLLLSKRLMSIELSHLRYYNMDTEPLQERINAVISQAQEHIKTNYPIIPLNIVHSLNVGWVKEGGKFTVMMDNEDISEDIFYYDELPWVTA